ncbi:MAG: 3-phosphoserine/phosphohydroxythreonine transaminase [Christensenellaceae bacterium]|nr:3-phosphoserine/phosphohydroxythreonine transaminase [Christensenellaceae bacterium]
MMKVYNFSAGPSMLYDEVKAEAQKDFFDYAGSGMSVTEMSHRSKPYEAINAEANALFRELMHIDDTYEVLFVQGGASQQFEAIPLNLLKAQGSKADYLVTGNFASKAASEAKKYADVYVAASSKDKNYTYIPKTYTFRDDADYAHFTYNNTIFGTRFNAVPQANIPLVTDISSNILSEEIDVNKFTLLYAGAQKNIGPSGLTVVIVKKDAIGKHLPICPTMLSYQIQADNQSLYNTPPCFAVYMAMLTLRHVKKLGGVKAVEAHNIAKAGLLYDFIDNSALYTNKVAKEDRSRMNVPFVTGNEELDDKFVKEAAKAGLVSIKGHRLAGGMRASIYNAMPVEGIKTLIEFMKKFEIENK